MIILTFILLARAFRSVVLPLKAVILNLISLACAYGVVVFIFQQGHGSEAIWNVQATGVVLAWVPLMIFAFLYGISMDYEVFMITRIRESYDETGDTSEAISLGLARTGKLVTSGAGVLMFAFFALSTGPGIDIKLFGIGLAAGVIIDATLIRLLLVPSSMQLLGRWNWWLPKWMATVLRTTPSPLEPKASHAAAADRSLTRGGMQATGFGRSQVEGSTSIRRRAEGRDTAVRSQYQRERRASCADDGRAKGGEQRPPSATRGEQLTDRAAYSIFAGRRFFDGSRSRNARGITGSGVSRRGGTRRRGAATRVGQPFAVGGCGGLAAEFASPASIQPATTRRRDRPRGVARRSRTSWLRDAARTISRRCLRGDVPAIPTGCDRPSSSRIRATARASVTSPNARRHRLSTRSGQRLPFASMVG